MTSSIKDKPEVGDLVIKVTSMETAIGVVSYVEPNATTPYFIEWLGGIMCGYTTAHSLGHIQQWSKNVRLDT